MKRIIPLATASLILSACGGGGGSSDGSKDVGAFLESVKGLEVPATMSVVQAYEELAVNSQKGSLFKSGSQPSQALSDPNTDFSTDPVNAYVYDASMESLDTVNMILCLLEQTRASDMVNQGAYIALVNEDKCETGENQSDTTTTGQSSGGSQTEYNRWTINSTRADDNSDQLVQIWVPGEENSQDPMDGQEILVEVTVTEGVSTTNPFAKFSMNFKGVVDLNGNEVTTMKGTLATVDNDQGQPQFRFINLGGDALGLGGPGGFSFEEAANVVLDDASATGGVAVTRRAESFNDGFSNQSQEASFAIAFNSDFLLRGKDDNGDDIIDANSCKSRNDFDTQVWRYNLYHKNDGSFGGSTVTAGERVTLNSGFPFHIDSNNDGQPESFGFVGYHGVWSETGELADGTVITEFDYETETETNHTLVVSAGKMMRRSSNNAPLSNLRGEQFQFWGEHPTLLDPFNNSFPLFGEWMVTVNADNTFQILGSVTFGENGPEVSTTVDDDFDTNTAEVTATVASFTPPNNTQLHFWSDSLGGSVNYVQDNAVAAQNRTVTFYAEEFMSPADAIFANGGSLNLFCYNQCLKGGLTQSNVDAAFSDQDLYHTYSNTPFQYTLSIVNGRMVLKDHLNAVVSAVGLDLSAIGYEWGIQTGDMVTTALSDPTQPWLVHEAASSFRWETGNNEWNRLVSVADAQGNITTFDKPLQFSYQHSTANDANGSSSSDGKRFFLEYGGQGDLWGFPWEEDTETRRWYSAVTLADGVTLTDGTNEFVVKAIDKEQTMKDSNGCGALNVDSLLGSLPLPAASDMGEVTFASNDRPVVTSAPAVVEGELKVNLTE